VARRLYEPRVTREAQSTIENDPSLRDPRWRDVTDGELGVVDNDRVDADRDRVLRRAKVVHFTPCRGSGEPPTFAAPRSDPAVARERELQCGPGAVTREGVEEGRVELARFVLAHAHRDLDASRAQTLDAAGGGRIGVADRDHASRDASGE